MRKHTLEATGGQTYAQMGRFLDGGKPTSDEKAAAIDPKTRQPVANPAAQHLGHLDGLTTALNTAFFAENVATFAIVMGIALLLVGIGFLVLTLVALRPQGPHARGCVGGLASSDHDRLTSIAGRPSTGPAPALSPGGARRRFGSRSDQRVRRPPQPDRGPAPMAPGRSPRTVGPVLRGTPPSPAGAARGTASTPRSATSCGRVSS